MQAVRKQAQLPEIMALTTTLARSARLEGAIAPMLPKLMPMELMLLKPHSAYVAMISARFCTTPEIKKKCREIVMDSKY